MRPHRNFFFHHHSVLIRPVDAEERLAVGGSIEVGDFFGSEIGDLPRRTTFDVLEIESAFIRVSESARVFRPSHVLRPLVESANQLSLRGGDDDLSRGGWVSRIFPGRQVGRLQLGRAHFRAPFSRHRRAMAGHLRKRPRTEAATGRRSSIPPPPVLSRRFP
jgi:hypothetical protein